MKSIDDLYRRIGEYPWRDEADMAEFDALVDCVRDEMKRYESIEKLMGDKRCAFCGSACDEVTYMVESPLGQCICDKCAVQCIHLMLNNVKG
jgi:hypothetical protein